MISITSDLYRENQKAEVPLTFILNPYLWYFAFQ